MSNSVRPQRWQPTRLPRPWDSPGKKLEWAAISFSSAWKWKVKVKLLSHVQLFVTPWTTRLSVHGVFQARVLEWGTIASSDKGILLKHKKEQNNVIFSNMNTIRDYHIKWSKSERESEVTQSCLTLSDPMDCSLPGFSAHGIFQARVWEWGAIAFSNYYSRRRILKIILAFYNSCVLGTFPELVIHSDFLKKWRTGYLC